MKEATGDMTMTIVVIVGIIAVLALGTTVIWPIINRRIQNQISDIDVVPITYVVPTDSANI